MASPGRWLRGRMENWPKNSEIARSFWVKSDRFWRILFYVTIFRVLTKKSYYCYFNLTTFYLSYLICVQKTHHTSLGVYFGDESYLIRQAILVINPIFYYFLKIVKKPKNYLLLLFYYFTVYRLLATISYSPTIAYQLLSY